MSTRAIIKARDSEETWSLYCHRDGYPSHLGRMVLDFVELAPRIDPNNKYYQRGDSKDSYNPYQFIPNVSLEAGKFIASLAGYLWQQGYTSAYMTSRNPREEREKGGTDIEWLYEVVLGDRLAVQVFKLTSDDFAPVDGEQLQRELKGE